MADAVDLSREVPDGPSGVHVIGSAAHRYRFERSWAKLPRWWSFGSAEGEPGPPRTVVKGAVAPNGDVYVLCRGAHPVIVFDAEGRFVTSWGEGRFSSFVHGLTIDREGRVWIADAGRHMVTRHEPSGEPLATLGTPDAAAPTFYGAPFNMPTGVAFSSAGEVFVSDGYGNRRVHCFSRDGRLLRSWGEPGGGPGQFALVHYLAADDGDRLYVCDRENHRIQVFSPDGEVLGLWTGFRMPSDLAFGREAIFVAGGDGLSIWTKDREPILRWGPDDPFEGAFNVHGIWLDADENIYLAQFDRVVSKLTRI
jgi:DNA-binding beta-propeller fold protein YncE